MADRGKRIVFLAALLGASLFLGVGLYVGTELSRNDVFDAVREGDTARVKALLRENPHAVAFRDKLYGTPLHNAAWDGKYAIVALLLQSGAEVNAREFQNFTPLHCAAVNGHASVVSQKE